MYLNYSGLDNEPFHITPDPKVMFLSPSHKEEMGAILYGVEKRTGLIPNTGEKGMGKTPVVRATIDVCDQSRNRLVCIFNTGVDCVSLLRMFIAELSPESAIEPGADESRLLDQQHRILIEEYSAGST
ncbi:peptidoglycan-binding protein, partial [Oceanidesulfovibrio marinus]